jgi:hypothetical protein
MTCQIDHFGSIEEDISTCRSFDCISYIMQFKKQQNASTSTSARKNELLIGNNLET